MRNQRRMICISCSMIDFYMGIEEACTVFLYSICGFRPDCCQSPRDQPMEVVDPMAQEAVAAPVGWFGQVLKPKCFLDTHLGHPLADLGVACC